MGQHFLMAIGAFRQIWNGERIVGTTTIATTLAQFSFR
jgi:hypothetical protein